MALFLALALGSTLSAAVGAAPEVAALKAGAASPGAEPPAASSPLSHPATPIPWSELGAHVAKHDIGAALSVQALEDGRAARLETRFQRLAARVEADAGLWLHSTVSGQDSGRMRVIAHALGRGDGQALPLSRQGVVRVADQHVRWERSELTEEYSVSVDGLRQDFLLDRRPAGQAPLRLELAVEGARAEAAEYGARLRLADGRTLAYGKLHVEDAQGTVLAARMEVAAAQRIDLLIDDARAVYPLRIDPTFSDEDWVSMGTLSEVNGGVWAIAHDETRGRIYLGGDFREVGAMGANAVVQWDGSRWAALGSGTDGFVTALALDAAGNLYAGGLFTSAGGNAARNVARWNPVDETWSALGSGVNGLVYALALDSAGDVYAGGWFDRAGGSPAANIARWNPGGGTWSALGDGVGEMVFALAVDRDDRVYAGGDFFMAGGSPAGGIARWNPVDETWSTMGGGVDCLVAALALDSADNLYVGGCFTEAGGVPAANVARWNLTDETWSPLGAGVDGTIGALAVDGAGNVYAGGVFTEAGGSLASHLARWTPGTSSWSTLGGGVNDSVLALALDESSGKLLVGGQFTTAGALAVGRVASWDTAAETWSRMGAGPGSGPNGPVHALAHDGDGNLYVGGEFLYVGALAANRIARWDGDSWSPLAGGLDSPVVALALDSASALYAGGAFTLADGLSAEYVARWDPAAGTWSALGDGVGAAVHALAVDSADRVYAGGMFTLAGGAAADHIARWDPSAGTWSALGDGVDDGVIALAVDGADVLYAAGYFWTAGGNPAEHVARWDISTETWSALGGGVNSLALALAVDSAGHVYVGGTFTEAGGSPARRVARWNPADETWSALGAGVDDWVLALAVDGSDNVYAGGYFLAAGGSPASRIARWNPAEQHWSAMGAGVNNDVYALTVVDGASLFAGGEFTAAGGKPTPRVARADLRGRVLYQGNGHAAGSVPVDGNRYLPGASASVLGNSGGLARAGHSFAGWNTRANGSGTDYAPGASLVPGTAGVVLHARWAPGHTVSASAGPGGSISPGSVMVIPGDVVSFTLLPQIGYQVGGVSGCGGSLSGLTYTTAPITAPCAVTASFALAEYPVEAIAGAGGRISPERQWVAHGGSASFSVTPDTGFSIALVSGCGGSLSGNTYITGPITSPCSVLASFSRDRYPVSTQVSAGGRLSPESQLVEHGERASFSVSVDSGYRLLSVSGCGGALSDDTYTTGPVTGACTVSAEFASDLPEFGPIEPVRVDAAGLFTPLPEGIVLEARDRHGNALTPTLVGGASHYPPGRHTLTWRAEDAEGRVATAEQRLDVWPQVSLSQDLRLGYDASGSFQVLLNGPVPEYPLTVHYGVGGSAQVGVDHALVAGSVTFTGGTEVSVPLQTLAGSGVDTELVVSLEPGVNRGARQQLVATLVAHNVAPHVELRAWQGGRPVAVVARDGGAVSLVATVTDPNPQDTHQGEWRVPTDAVVSMGPNGLSLGIDPLSLSVGLQAFELTVTDSGTPAAVTVVSLPLNVIESAPALGGGDSNGNGIPDNVEGDADSNGNGIPDYLDGNLARNVLPSEGTVFDRFLLEAEPGLSLNLGPYAIAQGLGGSRLWPEALPRADGVGSAGGYFDFRVGQLLAPGQSVRVVLPQQAPVPAGAVYRKYSPSREEWFTFVEDGRNGLASAPGKQGYCPPPGDSAYSPGLTEGHWCVQLTLEDGGPNDADGAVNGEVLDPGGVASPVPERRRGGGAADLVLLLLGLVGTAGLRYRRAFVP